MQEKAKSQVLISIVLISVLYLIPPSVAPVHADSVGKVCIAANGSTSCPATPPLLNSTNALPIRQVRVAVVIDGSEGLTGFDVILQTDHTILRPASVDLRGTVLHGTPVILAECLSGQLKAGSACSPKDTTDTIELAATSSVGSSPTNPPTTGLLFTATYNITGSSANILIGFQAGCSLTSATGTCVTIAGLSGNDPETVQSAKFTDQNYFDIQGYSLSNPNGVVGLLTDPQRTTDTSLGINVTSINNFNGKVALAVTWPSSLVNFSATVSPTIAWVNNTVPSSVFSPNPPAVTLRIGANAPPGTYLLNFTGTSGSLPPNILSITLTIPAADFVIVAAPTFLKFNVSSSGAAMISLLGIANFSGTVGLTLSRLAGLNASLSDSHLTITNGNSVRTTLTVNSTKAGIYELNVTGTFGQITHTTTVGVQVLDFTIATRDPVVVLSKGATGSEELFVGSAFYAPYNVTVTIAQIAVEQIFPNGTSGSSSGISVACTPSVLTLTSFGFPDALVTSNCQIQAITDGNYVVRIIGSAGRVTHFATFSVQVGPNFDITANPQTLTVVQGLNATSNLTLTALSGFTGTVTLTASVTPSGLSVILLPNSIVLSNNTRSSTILIITSSSTSGGTYNVTILGTSGTLSHTASVMINVILAIPDFSMTAAPSYLTMRTGGNSTSTITIGSVNGFSGSVSLCQSCSVTPLQLTFNPSAVALAPGESGISQLRISASPSLQVGTYSVIVEGTSGTLFHVVILTVQVLPGLPPIANFTYSPTNPVAGQITSFDGSGSSGPNGGISFWTWNFGDSTGTFSLQDPFTNHVFFAPGNYTVTLTVQDQGGLTGSISKSVRVEPLPQHDVSIVQVNAYPTIVASTESVSISTQLRNTGLANETVSLTAYANGHAIRTINGIFLQECTFLGYGCYNNFYEQIVWNTTGVSPGNYTISVSVLLPKGEIDPTPSDNSLTDGVVTVLPPPIITLTPTSGTIGSKIQVQATGFTPPSPFSYFNSEPVWVTFDNNFLGEAFAHNGSFTFTFDVIEAQPGPHLVIAQDLYTGARATAPFTVTASPSGSLSITVNTGTVYFPGDTVVVYVLTTFNGAPPGPGSAQLHLFMFGPSGSNVSLTAIGLSPGVYRATYPVPRTGPLGTYLLLAKASGPANSNASAITTLEVKLSWLSSNGGNIAGAATAAGLVGVAAIGWKKGYFRRKREDEAPQFS